VVRLSCLATNYYGPFRMPDFEPCYTELREMRWLGPAIPYLRARGR